MAIHAPITAASECASLFTILLSHSDRDQLASFIEAAIDKLDTIDPDSELELNGDETDHNGAEDDFVNWSLPAWYGPGCEISDAGGDPLDKGELDETYGLLPPKWGIDQTRGPTNEVAVYRAWQQSLQLEKRC